jgi:hypothetical protein
MSARLSTIHRGRTATVTLAAPIRRRPGIVISSAEGRTPLSPPCVSVRA